MPGRTRPGHARSPLAAARTAIERYRLYAASQRKNLDQMDAFFAEKAKLLGGT